MTLSVLNSSNPLYTIILRDPEANNRLTKWSTTSSSIQCRIDQNKMHIYDHNTLSLFIVTWTHSWDNLVIWDPWVKRHISV